MMKWLARLLTRRSAHRSRDAGATAGWMTMPVFVALGFALLLGLQGFLIQQGLVRLRTIGGAMDEVVAYALPAAEHAQAMQNAVQNRIILMLRMAAQPDPLEREPDARMFEREGLSFGQARDALLAMNLTPTQRQTLERLLEQAVALSRSQRAIVQALLEGRDEDAHAQISGDGVLERQRDLVAGLREFADTLRGTAVEAQRRAHALQQETERVVVGLGLSLFILGVMIGVVVTRITLRAERVLRDEMERSRHAAHTDPLTGLCNRRGFEEARQSCLAADPSAETHALLLIDLDHFKPVNDSAGHDAGDALLQRIARLLGEAVRPHDVVARLGGDEFAILLRDASRRVATEVAQRIVTTLDGFVFEWKGRRYQLGASVGVTVFEPARAQNDWAAIMKAADDACYEAKRGGRGRYAVAWASDLSGAASSGAR